MTHSPFLPVNSSLVKSQSSFASHSKHSECNSLKIHNWPLASLKRIYTLASPSLKKVCHPDNYGASLLIAYKELATFTAAAPSAVDSLKRIYTLASLSLKTLITLISPSRTARTAGPHLR